MRMGEWEGKDIAKLVTTIATIVASVIGATTYESRQRNAQAEATSVLNQSLRSEFRDTMNIHASRPHAGSISREEYRDQMAVIRGSLARIEEKLDRR